MATQQYINLYNSIAPSYMKAYEGLISKICFGIKPDSNKQYSFMVNEINGHFFFQLSQKFERQIDTPQAEEEAKQVLNELITLMHSNIQNAYKNNASFPEDFPILFNRKYMKLQSISPNYAQTSQRIVSWTAIYAFELPLVEQNDSSSEQAKSLLENDSIVIELSGKRIMSMYYNHCPIYKKRTVERTLDLNNDVVYKKINGDLLAPYYLTSEGYIPVCAESVVLRTEPVQVGWPVFNPIPGNNNGNCKSMLTLSNIVHPTEGQPGSAKIVIAMDYVVVTEGIGSVETDKKIIPEKFTAYFKKGNIPQKGLKKISLKLDRLPIAEALYIPLKRITNNKSTNYYNITIDYQFNVEPTKTLWDALKWFAECPNSRGFIASSPNRSLSWDFYQEFKKIKKNSDKSLKDIQIEFKPKAVNEAIYFLIQNLVESNIEKYSNKNIFIGSKPIDIYFPTKVNFDFSYPKTKQLLDSINSSLYETTEELNTSKPWIQLDDFWKYQFVVSVFFDKATISAHLFEEKDDADPRKFAKGGFGFNGEPNIIILNHNYFDKDSVQKMFGTMNLTEIVVHEAGHNCAENFIHETGEYEYNQVGLQSNEGGSIYPTIKNTLEILNDIRNQKWLKII